MRMAAVDAAYRIRAEIAAGEKPAPRQMRPSSPVTSTTADPRALVVESRGMAVGVDQLSRSCRPVTCPLPASFYLEPGVEQEGTVRRLRVSGSFPNSIGGGQRSMYDPRHDHYGIRRRERDTRPRPGHDIRRLRRPIGASQFVQFMLAARSSARRPVLLARHRALDTEAGAKFAPLAHKLARKHFLFGYVFELDKQSYETAYLAGGRPNKPQLDTQYGVCFRYLVYWP
jgi:hypothetical protein